MRQLKYSFLALLGNKTILFWTLLFPLILGTFFSLAFGNINAIAEDFSQIPVAVVVQETSYFADVLDELAQGDDALIVPQYLTMPEAEKLLESGDIDGIFEVTDNIRLLVSGEGINQSILKSISDSYLQISGTVGSIAQTRPDMVAAVIASINEDVEINHEETLGKGETEDLLLYYFALMAMTCMFGSFFGSQNVLGIQANRSPIAARRCVTPVRKISMILSDFTAAVALLFCVELIVLCYLTLVLKVNFGDTWALTILTALVGSITGVSFGTFITTLIPSSDENLPIGILTGVSLLLSFLSGLMYGGMKYIIEKNVPIINRINPAALLSDAFYSLVVYDNYSKYTMCIVSLLVISAMFCVGSALVLRRKQYADI